MKATGIVRRIDDLGRVVIPKEIRRTMRIREGDPLEIFVDREGEVILKKYSPIGELGEFAKEYADALHESMGHIVCIADRDSIIAVSGGSRKEFIAKPLGNGVEKIMEERRVFKADGTEALNYQLLQDQSSNNFTGLVVAPIIAQGDPIGAVILCSREENPSMGQAEEKVALTAASFLAKQMEQ
ncbi:MAG: stage V sporulation protein T [Clostridia bacterium]|nr:stage V sporulation protein T [Clostridia bacterium]